MKLAQRLTMLIVAVLIASFGVQKAEATVKNTAILKGSSLENGSNNLATTAPLSIKWDTKSLIDPLAFDHSITGDATKLVVKADGDYFVYATLPIRHGGAGGDRATSAIEVYVNGEPAPGAVSSSSMIRNTSGHSQASSHIATMLSGLKQDDVVELKTYRVNAFNVDTRIEVATLILEKVPDDAVVFHGLATESEEGANVNSEEGSGNALKWVSVREDSGFSLGNAGADLQLKGTGNYLVFLNLPLHQNGAGERHTVTSALFYDGGVVTGGLAQQSYIRNASAHRDSSNHWSGMFQADFANSDLRIETYNRAGGANNGELAEIVITDGKQASLTVVKLPNSDGIFFGSGTILEESFHWAPSTKEAILWDDTPVVDTSTFDHDPDGDNAQTIKVKSDGNYLLVYNDTMSGGAARTNPVITAEVNGVEVPGATTKTHYIRQESSHANSSGSFVTILDGLKEGDIVTVSSVRNGGGGSPIPEEPAILFLQKKEDFIVPDGLVVEPRLTSIGGDYHGWDAVVQAFGSALDLGSISATLDGEAVEVTSTAAGNDVSISFRYDDLPDSGTTHNVVITMSDTATPPNTFTQEFSFSVNTVFSRIPAEFAADNVDTSKPGFIAHVSQISTAQSGAQHVHGNRIAGANSQLLGEFKDADGNQYLNETGSDSATKWELEPVELEGVINFEQDGGFAGNFNADNDFIDEALPGIPGFGGTTDGIAAEFLTYLELKKGFYTFGVNSDDGFEVKSGPSVNSLFASVLGQWNNSRGASDSLFNVVVSEDGIYPFRLLWWEGGGGASVEFFSVHEGERILINDRDNPNAIKAYREAPGIPYVKSLDPSTKQLTDSVSVNLVDGVDVKIDRDSIKLLIDGAEVAAEIAASGSQITVSFKNDGNFAAGAHTIELQYDLDTTPAKSESVAGSFEIPSGLEAILLDNPIAYWTFADLSDARTDSSVGSGLNARLFNGPTQVERLVVGDPSPAIMFDKANQAWMDIADHPDINNAAGNPGWEHKTIEFWFNARNLPTSAEVVEGTGLSQRQVIYEQGGATRGMNVYLAGIEEENPTKAELWFNVLNRAEQVWGGTLPAVQEDDNGDPRVSPNADQVAIKTEIEAGKTYHVVLVMDGDNTAPDSFEGKLIGYINGEKFGEVSGVHLLYNHTDDVGIGRRNEEVSFHDHIVNGGFSPVINPVEFFYYDGVIDHFALYNEALTEEQIAAHLEASLAEVPADPIGGGNSGSDLEASIALDGGNITIEFSGGKLQSADSINGPWSDVAGATSPAVIPTDNTQKFYRVVQ